MNVSFIELSTGTGSFTETYTTTTASVEGSQAFQEGYVAAPFGGVGYRVQVAYTQSGTTLGVTAWVLKNGTVAILDYLGRNVTGNEASSLFQGIMYPFTFQAEYGLVVTALTATPDIRSSSAGTTSLSGTTLDLTRYSASTLPVQLQLCNTALDLSGYSLETASVTGSQLPLISSIHIAGNATYEGQTNEILSLSLNLTSLQESP